MFWLYPMTLMLCLTLSLEVVSLNDNLTERELPKEKAGSVDFCKVVKSPDLYSGKVIKVKAIIVSVIGPTSDGDTLIYDAACVSDNERLLVHPDRSITNLNKIDDFIRRLFPNQKVGRAEVTIIGKLHGPDCCFGYSLNYRYAFEILGVEKMKKLSPSTIWPEKFR